MLDANSQAEFDALLPGRGQRTRRAALKTAVGVGWAASVLPTMAQSVIRTPNKGLRTGEIAFDVKGFSVPAYMAAPEGRANLPTVLIVHEIFGVHEHIADVARRFAHAGYLAIAPELYARQGDPAAYGEMAKLMAEIVSKVPDAQVMADLDGAANWAATHGGDPQRLAITGFCYGGRITWLYAAHNPQVKAGVAWYGRLVGQATALTPVHPVDVAGQLHGAVLGLYGGEDTGIPLASVEQMKQALASAGAAGNPAAKASEFIVYPQAPHAFHADYRPSYREGPAHDGWQRALAWLRRHGV